MKFTAKASTLAKELAVVAPLAGKRHTIPVLNCVLIKALDGLSLTTTDVDSVLRSRIYDGPFGVVTPGALCVDAKRLAGIVGSFKPDAEVMFTAEENDWLTVECGGAKLKLPGIKPEDFPAVAETPGGEWAEVPSDLLADVIRKTTFAADDNRGMRLTIADKKLSLEATDGNRASVVSRAVETAEAVSILAHKECYELLAGLLKDTNQPVQIKAEAEFAWFAVGPRRLRTRTLNKPWSDITRVLTHTRKTAGTAFGIDRQELLASVRRAELSAPRQRADKDDGATGVEMLAANGALTLKADESSGQAVETLPVDYHAEELDGRFSSIYLRQFLAVCADKIKCQLNKAKDAPVLFLDDAGHEYVLMGRRK